ncbi:MAG: hypothetical protein P8Y03_02020 [Anaerolineales bacterium]|jgi:hypothetical protein
MYRKPKHVVVISTILILVLTVIGVAYTNFTGANLILGSVSTADMKLDWDISSGAVCEIDPADPSQINVTITGAVPGRYEECGLVLQNNGAVDVQITATDIEAEEDPATGLPLWTLANGSDYLSDPLDPNFDPTVPPNTNDGEVFVEYIDGVGSPIDVGFSEAGLLKVSVEDYASPSTVYKFTVTVSYELAP